MNRLSVVGCPREQFGANFGGSCEADRDVRHKEGVGWVGSFCSSDEC